MPRATGKRSPIWPWLTAAVIVIAVVVLIALWATGVI
jgi:hypothetical protein